MKGFIYLLSCEPHSNKYYIGLTTQRLSQRLSNHLTDVRYKYRNYPKSDWIRSLLRKGLTPVIEELETVEANDKTQLIIILNELEEFYISLFKSWNIILVNHGNGGKANAGRRLSDEAKRKLRIAHTGKALSEEHKKKISDANKKIIQSESKKRQISETLKGRKFSDERKKNIALAHKNIPEKDKMRHRYERAVSHAKLSVNQVAEIKELLLKKVKHKIIANKYGISKSNVSAISTGRGWKVLSYNI